MANEPENPQSRRKGRSGHACSCGELRRDFVRWQALSWGGDIVGAGDSPGGDIGMSKPKMPLPLEVVRQLYMAKLSCRFIAKLLRVSSQTIANGLKDYGVALRRGYKGERRGENNGAWSGNNATYHACHKRVYRQRGKASCCELCGLSDPSRWYEWASLTGNYLDVQDYKSMCRPCHRAYDWARKTPEEQECLRRKWGKLWLKSS